MPEMPDDPWIHITVPGEPPSWEGDLFLDDNGCFAVRTRLGGQPVIVHYDDVPDTDKTIRHGIPCTTALRTIIDVAPSVPAQELERMVVNGLERELFTIAEAEVRLAQPDMRTRSGAVLLRRVLSHLGGRR